MQFWWRDDDTGRDEPRLDRLLALAEATGRPLTLAVVPDWLAPATIERILACPLASVVQHGVAHDDHGTGADRKIELGGAIERAQLEAALVAGRERLEQAFGERFLPVMVPPWNRIADDVLERLPALGFQGISCIGAPPSAVPLRRVDVHVDAVDWDAGNAPRPAAELCAELLERAVALPGAPIGLMTHHQVLGEADWDDLDHVLQLRHDGVDTKWLTAAELFGGT